MGDLARTLPASWYTSLHLYQLERRAVFMKVCCLREGIAGNLLTFDKSWYLLGPVTRFQTIGQKVEYEVGQQPILASRVSGDDDFPGPDDIEVVCKDTVCAVSSGTVDVVRYTVGRAQADCLGQKTSLPCHSHRIGLFHRVG